MIYDTSSMFYAKFMIGQANTIVVARSVLVKNVRVVRRLQHFSPTEPKKHTLEYTTAKDFLLNKLVLSGVPLQLAYIMLLALKIY